jgi:hypothetical protein
MYGHDTPPTYVCIYTAFMATAFVHIEIYMNIDIHKKLSRKTKIVQTLK